MKARVGMALAVAVVALGGVGWAVWGSAAPPPAPVGPSVLVVMWDTVRADRLGTYGYDRPTTPRIDAWAEGAVVYERAISPGMWTVPAHGALFTGLPVSSHHARVGWLWLDEQHLTLAEHFGAAGYATYAWSSNPYLSEQTNLLDGFQTQRFSWRGEDAVRTSAATQAKLIAEDRSVEISPGWVPSEHGVGWSEHLTAYKDGGPVIVDAFLEWVDGLPADRPFLAYLNFLEAHHPRVPSLAARHAVADDATVALALQTDMSLFRMMAAMEGKGSFDHAELAAMSATYDATLVDLDRATADLIDALAARGRLEDTIVVLVSDHGEHLGEGGMFDHRWSVGQSLVHVPLIVGWPAGLPPARVSQPVSTGDLFGSLLAWTGVAAPDVSLLPLGERDAVVTELVAPTKRLPEIRQAFPDLDPGRWKTRYRARLEGDLKLVRTAKSAQLYDLSADPAEEVDLAPSHPEDTLRMSQALQTWDRARPAYRKDLRLPSDRPGNPFEADEGLAEQLKMLGYTTDKP